MAAVGRDLHEEDERGEIHAVEQPLVRSKSVSLRDSTQGRMFAKVERTRLGRRG